MKTVRRLRALVVVAPLLLSVAAADEPATARVSKAEPVRVDSAWGRSYANALERATAEKKAVLLNFTGSDWCVWCHRLRDEVLNQKPFLDYARDALVLVEVDFPRRTPQSPEEKTQNEALAKRFEVTGYPTIVLVDATGRELGRTGYMEGGPKTFVREIKRLRATASVESRTPTR